MADRFRGAHSNNLIDHTAEGSEAVLRCDADSYCCDGNRPDEADPNGRVGCCDTSKKPSDFFALPNGTPIFAIANVTATKSPNASVTTASTASSSNAPTRVVLTVFIDPASSISSVITLTFAPPQSTSSASNSTSTQTSSSKGPGIRTGGGVGIPVGIVALVALVFFLWRYRKNKKSVVRNYVLPPNSIYMNNADPSSPYTTTSASPEINQRASEEYSGTGSEPGHTEYRGVSTTGLGRLHTIVEFPDSPSRFSDFNPSNLQVSEPVGLENQPHELPEHPYT
ncbi:hypothetical protein MMC07_002874 [Pseudocyphellaria aurata]|nr:hypothetical protein [Pseudocyphellaria aurata]